MSSSYKANLRCIATSLGPCATCRSDIGPPGMHRCNPSWERLLAKLLANTTNLNPAIITWEYNCQKIGRNPHHARTSPISADQSRVNLNLPQSAEQCSGIVVCRLVQRAYGARVRVSISAARRLWLTKEAQHWNGAQAHPTCFFGPTISCLVCHPSVSLI